MKKKTKKNKEKAQATLLITEIVPAINLKALYLIA